jgi:hypothetical protein
MKRIAVESRTAPAKASAQTLSMWAQLTGEAIAAAPNYNNDIDDSEAGVRNLESLMLFPAPNSDHQVLRESYRRIEQLELTANQLRAMGEPNSGSIFQMNSSESEDDPSSLELVPKQYLSGPVPVTVMSYDLARMLERPATICSTLALRHSSDGLVAGALLAYMRLMELKGIQSPVSLCNAKAVAWRNFGRKGANAKNQSGSDIYPRTHYSPQTLDKAWGAFAPVAHLWAAFLALNGFKIGPVERPLHGVCIADLLHIADLYDKWGSEFFSRKRNRKKHSWHMATAIRIRYVGKIAAKPYLIDTLPKDRVALSQIRREFTKRD